MAPSISRALVAALVGAGAGLAAVAGGYLARPELVLELDRQLPGYTSGFYPPEIAGETRFAWTTANAAVRLRDLDRRQPWRCDIRLQGQRPPDAPSATVQLAIDGVTLATFSPPGEYRDFTVVIPARPASRAFTLVTIASEPTFVPGPSDRRALGVQVDRIACRPQATFVLPSHSVMAAAAVGGGAFGAALALLGLNLPTAVLGSVVLALLQSVPLLWGLAPYGSFPSRAGSLALCIAGLALAGTKALEGLRREPLHECARVAIGAAAIILFLQLLTLLHPMKSPVDAVFHAHRLQWVLGGRYFFVQPMPDGVGFPYAIGLYLFAAPFAALTSDHVSLLRIVVCGWNALVGLLVYAMAAAAWNDRRGGVVALVLFHLVPLPFITLGNANLTFVFSAAVMAVTVATATVWPPRRRESALFGALFALASLALLSHVGVVAVLAAMLVAMAVLYRWLGGGDLKTRAWVVVASGALAAVFAFATYYAHFGEVYQKLNRVIGSAAPAAPGGTPADGPPGEAPAPAAAAARPVPASQRLVRTGELAVRAFSWPLLLLAIAGAWRAVADRGRDRLTLTVAAYVLTTLVFVFATALAPVDPNFVRYADEFIDRVYYILAPAAALLAARGVVWAWSRHPGLRAGAALALLGVAWFTSQVWLDWLR